MESKDKVSTQESFSTISEPAQDTIKGFADTGAAAAATQAEAESLQNQATAEFKQETVDILNGVGQQLGDDEERKEYWAGAVDRRQQAQKLYDEMLQNPVDRGKLLSSTGNKIAAYVAAALGGLLVPFLGKNIGLEAVTNAIDADVAAQVKQHEQRGELMDRATNQYGEFLRLHKDRGAAIQATAAASLQIAAEETERKILESTGDLQTRAKMLREVRDMYKTANKMINDSTETGIRAYAAETQRKSMLAKQRKGGGGGRFDPGAHPVVVQGRGAGAAFVFSGKLAEKYGQRRTSLPTGIAEIGVAETKEIRDEIAGATRRVQSIDDVRAQLIDKIGDVLVRYPWKDDEIVTQQQVHQVMEDILRKSQRISDHDRPIITKAFAAEIGKLEFRSPEAIKTMLDSAQSHIVANVVERVNSFLPDDVEFRWSTVSVPKSPDHAIQGGAPDVESAPKATRKFNEMNGLAKRDDIGSNKWNRDVVEYADRLNQMLGKPGQGTQLVVGRLGGPNMVSTRLHKFQALVEEVGDDEAKGRLRNTVDNVLGSVKRATKEQLRQENEDEASLRAREPLQDILFNLKSNLK
jgi:hypothetical protein